MSRGQHVAFVLLLALLVGQGLVLIYALYPPEASMIWGLLGSEPQGPHPAAERTATSLTALLWSGAGLLGLWGAIWGRRSRAGLSLAACLHVTTGAMLTVMLLHAVWQVTLVFTAGDAPIGQGSCLYELERLQAELRQAERESIVVDAENRVVVFREKPGSGDFHIYRLVPGSVEQDVASPDHTPPRGAWRGYDPRPAYSPAGEPPTLKLTRFPDRCELEVRVSGRDHKTGRHWVVRRTLSY